MFLGGNLQRFTPGKGMMRWGPFGTASSGSTPYYQAPAAYTTTDPQARLAAWKAAGIGHLRYAFNMNAFCAESNAATRAGYLTTLGLLFDAALAYGPPKIVLNLAPLENSGFTGFEGSDIVASITGSAFLTYCSRIAEIGAWLQANASRFPVNKVALGALNEMPIDVANSQAFHIAMEAAFRSTNGRHAYIASCSRAGDPIMVHALGGNEWPTWPFTSKNTLMDLHSYVPAAAARAGEPGTIWEHVTGISYPPNPADYQTVKDATWAAIDASGYSAGTKASVKATLDGDGLESLKDYYGLGPDYGGSNLAWLYKNKQDATWILNYFTEFFEVWRVARGLDVSQIYVGEAFTSGAVGTKLSEASQLAIVQDNVAAIDALGYSRCSLGADYMPDFVSGWGIPNDWWSQTSPYAAVRPDVVTAMNY